MNVLSLFDGMSCGQLALQRAEIKYKQYYASEVDKWAIKTTQHHFPKTVQLGDVRDVNGNKLSKIDLLIGGSPCKGFSRAGNGLNFEHPESKLFFEYIRILHEVKPKYFLLENVKMKKEWELEINKILKCRPLRINSSLVSAQTRDRLYWTNIPVNNIPINKRIVLSDIIESGETNLSKSYTIDSNYFKGGKKTPEPKNQSQRRNMIYQKPRGYNKGGIIDNEKAPTLSGSSWQHNNFVITHSLQPRNGKGSGGKGHLKKSDGKSYFIDTNNGQAIEYLGEMRKLTVKECCRLQTVPDDYFDGIVSNSQAYKMLGNGWTIDIIAHILSFIPQSSM